MSIIVDIEKLSKKYQIYHEQRAAYETLVDTLSRKVRNAYQFLRHPKNSRAQTRGEYEEFWALQNITMQIKEGDRVGLIGRNGSGKSTLLKILSRITAPTTGSVRIKGRVASLLEVGTGFHRELTGRENIFLNGAILGMSTGEIRQKFDAIVAFAEIEQFLDTPVKRFSSGMYMRLGMAIAAHLDPDLLLVDEVLAVGDIAFQEKCLNKLNELGNDGRTILFVSHDIGAMLSLCNKGVFLENGRIKESGSIDLAANAYMRTCGMRSLSWQGVAGDEHIRVYRAALSSVGPPKEFFYQNEPVQLDVEYEILRPSTDLIVGCSVWNRMQKMLASSYTSDDPNTFAHFCRGGRHHASFQLDTSLFYEGEYTVKIDCVIHNKKQVNLDEVLLKLPIFEREKDTSKANAPDRRQGLFLGNKWQLQQSA